MIFISSQDHHHHHNAGQDGDGGDEDKVACHVCRSSCCNLRGPCLVCVGTRSPQRTSGSSTLQLLVRCVVLLFNSDARQSNYYFFFSEILQVISRSFSLRMVGLFMQHSPLRTAVSSACTPFPSQTPSELLPAPSSMSPTHVPCMPSQLPADTPILYVGRRSPAQTRMHPRKCFMLAHPSSRE